MAISLMLSEDISEAETHACREPKKIRNPISTPSARSACSNWPSRTSIEFETPSTAIASAASAPASLAASNNCWPRSFRGFSISCCFLLIILKKNIVLQKKEYRFLSMLRLNLRLFQKISPPSQNL